MPPVCRRDRSGPRRQRRRARLRSGARADEEAAKLSGAEATDAGSACGSRHRASEVRAAARPAVSRRRGRRAARCTLAEAAQRALSADRRPELPTGTVTFLFTDIEGSTRLLHELGAERYAEALAEHRGRSCEALSPHGGVEVDTQGDAFFFAFPTAPGALAAARDGQAALAGGPIRVRIGLHTGSPLLTAEGYVGEDVHLAARIAAAGHGGQVLVSAATRGARRAATSTDLGEHRLKDFDEPVSIFQLGDGAFPPLKTISNTNLPRRRRSFVGRERELAEVLGAARRTARGSSRSRARRLGQDAARDRGGGRARRRVSRRRLLGRPRAAPRSGARRRDDRADARRARMSWPRTSASAELLLLLDNLEQVIDAAPELVDAARGTVPNLRCSSRAASCCASGARSSTRCRRSPSAEAVELFCARSQARADADDRRALPPPRRHAARGRARRGADEGALTPAQILERLSQRLDLLKGGRDADPRQQTLRATIEWSYELSSRDEQRLFARLSVFAGGCTLEAAEEVGGADLGHAAVARREEPRCAAPTSASGCSRRSASTPPSVSVTQARWICWQNDSPLNSWSSLTCTARRVSDKALLRHSSDSIASTETSGTHGVGAA